jgi:hypothetical protein
LLAACRISVHFPILRPLEQPQQASE